VFLPLQVPGEGHGDEVNDFSLRQEIVRQCSQHHAVQPTAKENAYLRI
jgi:hypothetical protein